MDLKELRAKHPALIYQGYQASYQNSTISLKYDFLLEPNIHFHPQLEILNLDLESLNSKDPKILDRLLFNLGLAELPSYWKAACPPSIKIIGHSQQQLLNQDQLNWWHDLLINGLSEFYFTNQIDFTQDNWLNLQNHSQENSPAFQAIQKPQINNQANSQAQPSGEPSAQAAETAKAQAGSPIPYLVPIGGGKDSALSLALLDEIQAEYACLLLQPQSPAAQTIVDLSQSKKTITLKRYLDPQLLELNQQGYLNGHTPFSAYLAFASNLAAYLYNCQQILLANERSANEGNTEYLGVTVNHQYSKTFAFEQSFRDYAEKHLFPDLKTAPEYLSFLRPLWEIQIAKLFSRYPKYFSSFKSCNIGQKDNIWCEACSKCLFVFIMLSPFVDEAVLSQQIFSHNLLNDQSLLPLAKHLLGLSEYKPFDCVGTYQETQAACYLAIKKYQAKGQVLPFILEQLKSHLPDENFAETSQKLLSDWNDQHFVPDLLAQVIKNQLE